MARKSLNRQTWTVVAAVDALPPAPWLVACSGGPDSLALAWAAAFVGRRRGTPVRALVVDHGLQDGSDAVASAVAAQLGALLVPDAEPLVIQASVVRVTVPQGAGPEASAREARYAALEAGVRPGERVLLGHTLDDQAETVLLGLARGSGARSLAGMAPERGVFLRPLLALEREVTAAACAELGLTPWRDPHNADPRFARVRVRETVLPVLEAELGPGVREALARTAALLRRDADVLDAAATAALTDAARLAGDPARVDPAGTPETLHCGWLAGLDAAIRDRVLRDWLLARGASDLGAAHVDAVAALVTEWRGQKGVDVPGARVRRTDGRLHAGETPNH